MKSIWNMLECRWLCRNVDGHRSEIPLKLKHHAHLVLGIPGPSPTLPNIQTIGSLAMLFHRIVYHHIELETVIRAINAQKTPVNAQCERDCRLTTNHHITSTCDNIHQSFKNNYWICRNMNGIGWNMNEMCWNIDGTFGIQGPYETSKDYVRI